MIHVIGLSYVKAHNALYNLGRCTVRIGLEIQSNLNLRVTFFFFFPAFTSESETLLSGAMSARSLLSREEVIHSSAQSRLSVSILDGSDLNEASLVRRDQEDS